MGNCKSACVNFQIELTTSVILTKKIMDLKIKAAMSRKSEQKIALDNQGQAKSEVKLCARISI